MDQLTGFRQVMALDMLQHFFRSYGAIDEIDLKEKSVKMMGEFEPVETLTNLTNQLEKRREFSGSAGKMI